MMVIALALHLDPAYVGAHQLVRYLAMSVVVPPLTVYLLRPRLPPPRNSPDAGWGRIPANRGRR
jgi:uncharacterized protein